jgi:hypothetical protein
MQITSFSFWYASAKVHHVFAPAMRYSRATGRQRHAGARKRDELQPEIRRD